MEVPDNSNIKLIVNMIKTAPDPEAMEFWIMSGLIHYVEECDAIDVDDYEDQEMAVRAYNMKVLGQHAQKVIELKHKTVH